MIKTKKFQNYRTAGFFALLNLESYDQPNSVIPQEYSEVANNVNITQFLDNFKYYR